MITRSKAIGIFWAMPLFLCSAGCVPIRQTLMPDVGFFSNNTAPNKEADEGKPGIGGLPSPKGSQTDAWKGEMEGIASWYGEDFNGHLTSSGEVYDM